MATRKTTKKTTATNRITTKKLENVTDEIEEKQYLTDLELSRVTLNAEKHEVFKRDLEIIDLKITALKIKKEVYEAQIRTLEKEIALLGVRKLEVSRKHKEFKNKSREELEEIGKAHGILVEDGFGYDPDSGEIITKT